MAKNNVPFKRRMSLTLRDMKRCIPLYLMIAPFMILFVVFVVYPVLMAIWYSFTDYNVLEKANFIGFDNYRKLFLDDDTFITAIKNTFIIAVIVGPGGYVLSFLLAWMINELPHKLGVVLTVFLEILASPRKLFYGCPIPNMLCLLLFWHLCGRALVLDSFPS